MTGDLYTGGWAEFDVVGMAVGTALVSGALSVAAPSLAALTGSLAALAWAGWIALVRRTTGSLRRAIWGRAGWAVAAGALGAGLFLLDPPVLAPARGVALGLSLVPLWAIARRMPVGEP
jgi:hypothetical protein